MKKNYIKPDVTIETMENVGICAGSGGITVTVPDTEPGEGDADPFMRNAYPTIDELEIN